MIRRLYADLGSDTDVEMRVAMKAGRCIEVDGVPARFVARSFVRVALGTDSRRRQYVAYDVEVSAVEGVSV
jgi:hypothetical protein